eukprot:g3304.t1
MATANAKSGDLFIISVPHKTLYDLEKLEIQKKLSRQSVIAGANSVLPILEKASSHFEEFSPLNETEENESKAADVEMVNLDSDGVKENKDADSGDVEGVAADEKKEDDTVDDSDEQGEKASPPQNTKSSENLENEALLEEQAGGEQSLAELLKEILSTNEFTRHAKCIYYNDDRGENLTALLPLYKNKQKVQNLLQLHGVGTLFGSMIIVPIKLYTEIEDNPNWTLNEAEKYLDNSVFSGFFSEDNELYTDEAVASVKAGAKTNFDYCLLVVIASVLAATGLATNNTVVIVASMLISPLMGPILAIVMGFCRLNLDFDVDEEQHNNDPTEAITNDEKYEQGWVLMRFGIITETIGCLLCVLVGLGFGWAEVLSSDGWPTVEMESRGEPRNLIPGAIIAIFSGLGVALSVLGSNTSSLVGVAISASLLPPAVNVGMCYAYAIGKVIYGTDNTTSIVGNGTASNASNTALPVLRSDRSAHDFVRIGSVSFLLYIMNICCIIVFGIIIFKVKNIDEERIQHPMEFLRRAFGRKKHNKDAPNAETEAKRKVECILLFKRITSDEYCSDVKLKELVLLDQLMSLNEDERKLKSRAMDLWKKAKETKDFMSKRSHEQRQRQLEELLIMNAKQLDMFEKRYLNKDRRNSLSVMFNYASMRGMTTKGRSYDSQRSTASPQKTKTRGAEKLEGLFSIHRVASGRIQED